MKPRERTETCRLHRKGEGASVPWPDASTSIVTDGKGMRREKHTAEQAVRPRHVSLPQDLAAYVSSVIGFSALPFRIPRIARVPVRN